MLVSRLRLTLAVVVVIATTSVVLVAANSSAMPRLLEASGPAALSGPTASGFAGVQPLGSRFTNGQVVVHNQSTSQVVLRSIKPITTGSGLRYLGAHVAGPDRSIGFVQFYDTFPPEDEGLAGLEPVEGAVLPAGEREKAEGFELLMGYEVVAEGRSTVTGVEVAWTVNGRDQSAVFPSTMAVCTDAATPCEQEYGDLQDS